MEKGCLKLAGAAMRKKKGAGKKTSRYDSSCVVFGAGFLWGAKNWPYASLGEARARACRKDQSKSRVRRGRALTNLGLGVVFEKGITAGKGPKAAGTF